MDGVVLEAVKGGDGVAVELKVVWDAQCASGRGDHIVDASE